MSDFSQGILHPIAVFGLVPEEKPLLGELLFFGLGDENGLKRVGVVAGIINLGGQGHGRGCEVLHLLLDGLASTFFS